MNSPAGRWNPVNIGSAGNINVFDGESIKDFGGGSSTDSVGEIVVAYKEEDGDPAGGQAINTFGKFALLGLGRLTTFVGVTTEDDKVYLIFQGVIYNLVKG